MDIFAKSFFKHRKVLVPILPENQIDVGVHLLPARTSHLKIAPHLPGVSALRPAARGCYL